MRVLLTLALCCAAAAAASAQTLPGGPDTGDTGARPGNIIGTGMSLPMSTKAGNLDAATTHSELAPNLPAPQGPEDVRSLLVSARQDLVTNQTGAAQEALERAETRALDRSIPAGTEHVPAQDPLVMTVTQARGAMAAGDNRGAINIIDGALRLY
jgi:hypothetical protein